MSNYEILIIALFIIGGLFKNPRKTIGTYAVCNLLFVVVYAQVGLYMAAVAIGLSCFRSAASLFITDKQNKYCVIITTTIAVCLVIIEINQAADLLVLMAAAAIGTSIYFRDNFIMYRVLSITSNTCWIIHSLIFGVYGMLVCASIVVATGIWVLYKHADLSSVQAEIKSTLSLAKNSVNSTIVKIR